MLDNLEQSFDRQKKFVSDASHELKTPIAVIQGYSNLLLRWGKSDPAVLDESLESIAREADNMKRIVEQLLLLAKIGRYMFTPENVELSAELSSVMDGYSLVCKTHKFEFVSNGEIFAKLDRNMFTECVRAVIDNAVKYSDENTAVTVTLKSEDGYAVIKIADCGQGISEADLPHIFDRFYRCDKSRNRDAHSSGLGLTIAKSIVEMMGGTIEAESELKKAVCLLCVFPKRRGQMNKRYVLLCDYGLDDAVATLYLLNNSLKGDRFDIMPVGGNSEVNAAYVNAQKLLAFTKATKAA